MMSAHLAAVQRLMDHWRNGRVEEFVGCFTDDVEYHYRMGSRPVQGKEKLRKFIANFSGAFEQREWRLDAWAANGELLLVEGYEELYDKQRDRIIRHPFMQAYEFRDGRVAKLRDYFDSEDL